MHLALRDVARHAEEQEIDGQPAVVRRRPGSQRSRPGHEIGVSAVGALTHSSFDADAFGRQRAVTEVDLRQTDELLGAVRARHLVGHATLLEYLGARRHHTLPPAALLLLTDGLDNLAGLDALAPLAKALRFIGVVPGFNIDRLMKLSLHCQESC